jgi:phage FluMu gp28-like protein
MKPPARTGPLNLLLPYQRAWVDDSSRWKIWLAARQVGKSFGAACEVVRDCHLRPKTQWVILSAGERQALEFMSKCRDWVRAFDLALEEYRETRDNAETLLKSAEARLANGSRIVALPANPDTARGYSANLVLDEFAFHADSTAIWRAILPSIANPLRGELRVRVLSTPNGQGNAFYQLWTDTGAAWSRHKTTIEDAAAAGLQVDIPALRRQLNDPDGWAQEFLCEFIDSACVLLPYDLIARCETAESSQSGGAAEPSPAGPVFAGIDIGRKRDLTVIWVLERIGDILWTREVRVLERVPFADQLQAIRRLVAARRLVRCCIDATGIGAMLAEELARAEGASRVEQCQFTAALKQELYPPLRRAFEDRLLRIPVSREIREDLHGLQKVTSQSGAVHYLADRTEAGHSDRATALALALRAASAERPGSFIRIAGGRWAAASAMRQRETALA